MVKIYKPDLNWGKYFNIGFAIFVIVFIPVIDQLDFMNWIILVCLLLIYTITILSMFRTKEIHIDKENKILSFIRKNYFGLKKELKFGFEHIQFTYKEEVPTFRSGKKNVCTFYVLDKKVLKLIPDDEDWSNETIKNIVVDIIEEGVKRKFVGYSVKDATI